MDIKAFKDGYVNIPALEEAKMTKAQRAEAKRKAKEALKARWHKTRKSACCASKVCVFTLIAADNACAPCPL